MRRVSPGSIVVLCCESLSSSSSLVLGVLEWLCEEASSRPGRSWLNDLRVGFGVAAMDVERRDDEMTSYLKRSANELDVTASLFEGNDWYTSYRSSRQGLATV